MGHYYSEIDKSFTRETKPMIEIPNTPVPIAMNNQGNAQNVGYTQVWEGRPQHFIDEIVVWAGIDKDYLRIEPSPDASNIALFVANEWIDWSNLRVMGTYRPAISNNYRSTERC